MSEFILKLTSSKNDLLQLLNYKSMKTAGMLLNFKNDSCQILGRYLKLQRTTSGHNNLPLTFGNLKIVLYCETLENVVE